MIPSNILGLYSHGCTQVYGYPHNLSYVLYIKYNTYTKNILPLLSVVIIGRILDINIEERNKIIKVKNGI